MVAPLLQQWQISGRTPGEGLIRRVQGIGHWEVGEHALHLQVGHPGHGQELLQHPLPLLAEKAQTGHARVQLQVHLQPGIGAHQASLQLPGVGQTVNLLAQVHLRQVPGILRRGISQNQNGTAHFAPAELHRFLQVGDCQKFRSQLLQMVTHRDRPVPIGVRLHHA